MLPSSDEQTMNLLILKEELFLKSTIQIFKFLTCVNYHQGNQIDTTIYKEQMMNTFQALSVQQKIENLIENNKLDLVLYLSSKTLMISNTHISKLFMLMLLSLKDAYFKNTMKLPTL